LYQLLLLEHLRVLLLLWPDSKKPLERRLASQLRQKLKPPP